MQLVGIQYVVTVAEMGSFTKAAEMLYVSQPALSQAIQRLERELNTSIFIRQKNTISLTPAGHIVVNEGKKILELEQKIRRQVKGISEWDVLSLNIGSAPSYQRLYLSKLISKYKNLFPYIELKLREGYSPELCEEILNGRLDAALVCAPVPDGVDSIPIFSEEVFLAVPPDHPLVELFSRSGDPYPVADLSLCKNYQFISYFPGRRIDDIFKLVFLESGYVPNILTACSSTESANTMVYHGMGLGIIPASTIELCPKEMHAKYYRLRPEGVFRYFVLARTSGEYKSKAQKELFLIASQLFLQI